MALLTTQTISRTKIVPTYAAVAASDTFVPGSGVFLHIKNAGGSSDTVVVAVAAGDPPGLTISDVSNAHANATEGMTGPFPANFFADPTTGLATVTHSFTTTVTVGVFNLSQP